MAQLQASPLNLRNMVQRHQGRERSDVILTIYLPMFLMCISSYTNAWAFTGGNFAWQGSAAINTVVALFKGLFLEALVFCFFKLFKILWAQPHRNYVAAFLILSVGIFAVIVSSGCGVAWAANSGEMTFLLQNVTTYLGTWVGDVFRVGLGFLFPVALAVLAVYDPKHMIMEHIESGADLSKTLLLVENAEHHQAMLRQAQQEANNDQAILDAYKRMAAINAQQAIESAQKGDYSFGLRTEPLQVLLPQKSSVSRVTPPTVAPPFAAPATFPFPQGQPSPPLTGQVLNNPPFTGQTQNLRIPAPQAPTQSFPTQPKKGLLNWMAGN